MTVKVVNHNMGYCTFIKRASPCAIKMLDRSLLFTWCAWSENGEYKLPGGTWWVVKNALN
jgi:hypothetical protein